MSVHSLPVLEVVPAQGDTISEYEVLLRSTQMIKSLLLTVYPLCVAYLVYYIFFADHTILSLASILFITIFACFMVSAVVYVRNVLYSAITLRTVGKFNMSIDLIEFYARQRGARIPRIAIFVPARNEGYVIENTIRRLVKLDYRKDHYHVIVITDERELDDDVEITTKSVVERVSAEVNKQYGTNLVQYVEVPKWYSGVFGSQQSAYEKSTKGRALNYALQSIAGSTLWQDIDFIGVVDADGRLHVNVLKELAYTSLRFNSKLLQGPVFQISNLLDVSIVGFVAALELALHHLTELSSRLMLNRFNFVAGTNYFVDKALLVECGAWNQYALVEDAELAMRLYIQARITATWLSCYEIEQTPPNLRVYCRQRERWVRGHLDLLPYVVRSELPLREKLELLSKVLLSQFRFIFDLGFPVVAIVYIVLGLIPRMNVELTAMLLGLLVLSFLIWDVYGLIYRRLTPYLPASRKTVVIIQSIKLFLFAPIVIGVQVVPRMLALCKHVFAAKQGSWYKTERTKEEISE